MPHGVTSPHVPRATLLASLATAFVLLAPAPRALAQEGGPPSPEEIQKKVVEIEQAMKKAEEALARSTSGKHSADDAARRIEKLLEEKAKAQTGKSCDQLRKEARAGSEESAEALARLTREAQSEAAKAGAGIEKLLDESGGSTREASDGVRKLIESTCDSGREAKKGIEWLLEHAVTSGSGN